MNCCMMYDNRGFLQFIDVHGASPVFLFNGFLQLQPEQYILHICMSEDVFYLSLVNLQQDEISYSHEQTDKHRFR